MASVFKRGRRYYCRMYVEGRDVWRSLGTADREEASRKAAALENAAKGRQWVRRQFDELVARAEREVQPDEAKILCESIIGGVRRLVQLIPADLRDAASVALSRSLLEAQTSKVQIGDGWERWMSSPRRASQPTATTIKNYSGIWRRFAEWA